MNGDYTTPIYLVIFAAVLDFFDGMVARLLGVSGPLGKQLDSLADMVTFGAVPGVFLFLLGTEIQPPFASQLWGGYPLFAYIAFAVTLFSALRLANFNIDERQSTGFIGLPTPANTLLILSIFFIIDNQPDSLWASAFENPWVFLAFTILSSYALVAEIPLIALKFSTWGWKGNEARYILIVLSLVLLLIWGMVGIPIIVLLYLLISWIHKIF
ncbi:MAG: CDP-alcohol phosphatidyltransferase family protein [Schleiferiaceae bacterium]